MLPRGEFLPSRTCESTCVSVQQSPQTRFRALTFSLCHWTVRRNTAYINGGVDITDEQWFYMVPYGAHLALLFLQPHTELVTLEEVVGLGYFGNTVWK